LVSSAQQWRGAAQLELDQPAQSENPV